MAEIGAGLETRGKYAFLSTTLFNILRPIGVPLYNLSFHSSGVFSIDDDEEECETGLPLDESAACDFEDTM